MRLISVDIETTGLDHRQHGVIQIAAVAFELDASDAISHFFIEIDPENMVWSQYCLELHHEWIKSVNIRKKERRFEGCVNYDHAYKQFREWAFGHGFYRHEGTRSKPSKPTVAGKCFGTFDANFLNFRFGEEAFRKRVMDPAHYYIDFAKDGDIMPELVTCKQRAIDTGCKAFDSAVVKHNALDDALDVMHLLRHAYGRGWMSGYQIESLQ